MKLFLRRWPVVNAHWYGILSVASLLVVGVPTERTCSAGFDSISYRPQIDGVRYATLLDSEVLNEGQLRFGADFSYAHRPLNFRQLPSQRLDEAIRTSVLSHLAIARGFSEGRFSLAAELPVGAIDFTDPYSGASTEQQRFVVGDAMIQAKFRFQDPILMGSVFLTIPTGFSSSFMGSRYPSGGFRVAGEFSVAESSFVTIGLGAHFRERYTLGTQINSHRLLYGIGYAFHRPDYTLSAELNGKMRFPSAIRPTGREPGRSTGQFSIQRDQPVAGGSRWGSGPRSR